MKNLLKYTLLLFLPVLAACGNDEEWASVAQQPHGALELSVGISDFTTYGDAPATRASESGATTTFENGDRAGVIVLEGTALKGNNLPYIYNNGSWSFDAQQVNSENSSGNGSSKSIYYYDSKATNVTYIVYYPYSTDADGVTSIEVEGGLKSKFTPKENQRSAADYRASDLMTWQSAAGIAPQKKLSVTLSHACNSVSLLPVVHYTLGTGEDYVHPSPDISDVNFVIDGKPRLPYAAADGSYRYILPSGLTESSVRCFYTVDRKTYSKELTVWSASATAANIRYSSTQKVSAGDYSLDKAHVGDFYCKSSDGKTDYLIPGEIASLTEAQQAACLGIVYYVGNITGDNYGLLDGKFPNGTHGLVVSLWEMPAPGNGNLGMTWTYGGYESVNNWLKDATWSSGNRPTSFSSIQETGKMQGYANTVALEEYNTYVEGKSGEGYGPEGSKRVKPVKGLEAFQSAHPAPKSSSGWYWPSVCELKQVCWGQGATTQGTSGKEMLNTQIGKVGSGTTFGGDYYWSSTERSDYSSDAWYVRFRDGDVFYYGSKGSRTFRVRPLFAF